MITISLKSIPFPAKIFILIQSLPVIMAIVTGFSISQVLEFPFILYHTTFVLFAFFAIIAGTNTKLFSRVHVVGTLIDKITSNKSLLTFILFSQFIFLVYSLSQSRYFDEHLPKRIEALLKLDFYRLRYVLIDNPIVARSDTDKTTKILISFLPGLFFTRFLPILNGSLARYPLLFNRQRVVKLNPLVILNQFNILILISSSLLAGSRTQFVVIMISFILGFSYSPIPSKTSTNILQTSFPERGKSLILRYWRKRKIVLRYSALAVFLLLLISFLILAKITNDRVGRFDGRTWLYRYEVNMGANSSLCNNLCSNPVVAGLTGYTVSTYLMSKAQFSIHEEGRVSPSDYGLGYKSYWFINRIFSKFPLAQVKNFAENGKWIYRSHDQKFYSKNSLSKSAWRGLLHDYIFDWGLILSFFMVFPPYFVLGLVYRRGIDANTMSSKLFAQAVAIAAVILSIAVQPFGPIFPVLIAALVF